MSETNTDIFKNYATEPVPSRIRVKTFSGSTDGVNYQQIKFARKKTDEYDYENIIESFSTKVEHIPFQFIRITTESFIQCPDWHLGAGGKAWIFADEIVVR